MVIYIIAASLSERGPDIVDTLLLHANVFPNHDRNKLEMLKNLSLVVF